MSQVQKLVLPSPLSRRLKQSFVIVFLLLAFGQIFAMDCRGIGSGGDRRPGQYNHRSLEFVSIPPSRFISYLAGHKMEVSFGHAFEIQTSPVTVKQWSEVMGFELPNSGEDLNSIKSLTWWSALEFANMLSVQRGLVPVYDLSGYRFIGNRKLGQLVAVAGKLTINSPNGFVEQAAGYRLPLELEKGFLSIVQSRSDPRFEIGNAFYDLEGMPKEWTYDMQPPEFSSDKSSQGEKKWIPDLSGRLHYEFLSSALGIPAMEKKSSYASSMQMGVRLVRSVD